MRPARSLTAVGLIGLTLAGCGDSKSHTAPSLHPTSATKTWSPTISASPSPTQAGDAVTRTSGPNQTSTKSAEPVTVIDPVTGKPVAAGATVEVDRSGVAKPGTGSGVDKVQSMSAAEAKSPAGRSNTAPIVSNGKQGQGVVVGLSIPAIGLNRSVRSGPVTSYLEPPSGVIQQVTNYGRVQAGSPGISVMAGHVTWNGPDVFYRLPRVPIGARAIIRYANGGTKTFVVSGRFSTNKNSLEHDARVWGSSSTPKVALVTCDSNSAWSRGGRHHVNNFVVTLTPA